MAAGVIHGDIKPQNVLVYMDSTGKTIVKVADFGYSTLATGEAGRVLLPKSRPWNAPEHHFGQFTVAEARKTDIYSFGMLCLWILFGSVGLAQTSEEFTFEASAGAFTSLEQLKDNDQLDCIANELLDSIPPVGLSAVLRSIEYE